MGRPFNKELSLLNLTYEFAMKIETKEIESFLRVASNQPLLIVGSGGSYTVAKAVEYIHMKTGGYFAKAITPFELTNYDLTMKNLCVVLLTAGGNNPDTINSYKYISGLNPISFLTICMSQNSKVSKLASSNKSYYVNEVSLPSGKDGFLSVNSLIGMLMIISKAYSNILHSPFVHLKNEYKFNEGMNFDENNLSNVLAKENIFVLHGGLTTPCAIDLESKFTEAALMTIQLSDYRNFAHGRHYWLSRNLTKTSVIALVSPKEAEIAKKTLLLLPSVIDKLIIKTDNDSVMGIVEMFDNVFQLTSSAGEIKNCDPGKPKVPEFGRKIYHTSYSLLKNSAVLKLNKVDKRAAYRKSADVRLGSDGLDFYIKKFGIFYKKLLCSEFHGIVFDYDDTLKNRKPNVEVESEIFKLINKFLSHNIVVYIATGRGKSVRKELQEKISPEFWDDLKIAYYNGGHISPLSDMDSPNILDESDKSLVSLYNELVLILDKDIEIELRPKQMTISIDKQHSRHYIDLIKEISMGHADLKMLESGHSIDIIPKDSSKRKIIEINEENKLFLCFGDSGQYTGNDFELLNSEFGISVNRVSKSFETCWNFAPMGLENSSALLYYLNCLNIVGEGKLVWREN